MSDPVYLDPDERRVIGVLIEKSLTTPQYYPMTINAIVVGSNQKSARDPIVEFVDDEVQEILKRLRLRSLVSVVYPAGGRSEKWRQELTTALNLDGTEMAILGELLLRGPQTVGDLRARASRMKPIPDQDLLQQLLDKMAQSNPPLVVRLTAAGVKRGVRVTHALYPAKELEALKQAEESGAGFDQPARRASGDTLAPEIEALRQRIEAIEKHLGLAPPPPNQGS